MVYFHPLIHLKSSVAVLGKWMIKDVLKPWKFN